jgi:hypothetical protein
VSPSNYRRRHGRSASAIDSYNSKLFENSNQLLNQASIPRDHIAFLKLIRNFNPSQKFVIHFYTPNGSPHFSFAPFFFKLITSVVQT